jgi:hypothetical protein
MATRFGIQSPVDDTATLNLDCARDLRRGEAIDIPSCLRKLDGWAALVGSETERLSYLFRRNPAAYDHSEARFRILTLMTVLQRDLGVRYRQELMELPDQEFFENPDHLFIHAVIQGKGGSCSSLPPAYAAVGRRLGYPLRLVKTAEHVFARWDDPGGERFNIECTSLGFVSHPDDYYRHWPKELTPEQERSCSALRSLTCVQEIALYFCTRGHCLAENFRYRDAVQAYARAADMDPDDASYRSDLLSFMDRWDRSLRFQLFVGFPPMRLFPPPRRYPRIPEKVEQAIHGMYAQDMLLGDPTWNNHWWSHKRFDRNANPAGFPAFIVFRYPDRVGEEIQIEFRDTIPADFDHANAIPC